MCVCVCVCGRATGLRAIPLLAEDLLTSQDGLYFMVLVI